MTSGYDIISIGADYSANAAAFDMPAPGNCLFWSFFGGSVAQSIRNLARGQADATQYGGFSAGDISAAKLSVKSGARAIRTANIDTAEGTIFIAARNTDALAATATQPCFVASGSGGTSGGIRFFPTNSTTVNFAVGSSVAGGGSSLTVPSVSDWRLYCATYGEIITGSDNILYDLTGGTNSPNNHGAGGVRVLGVVPVTFGSAAPGSSIAGTAEIAFGAHYNTRLTQAQMDAVAARARAVLSLRGVTV